jgi:hypothetical protein
MHIGSEAPKRRTHSSNRHESQGTSRESATSDRHWYPITSVRTGPKLSKCLQRPPTIIVPDAKRCHPVQRPCHTNRHRAISSLRAKATIMGLRAPRAFSVRARYFRAKALSFWYVRNRHANWTMPRRTRPLPERANRFSRLFLPLSSSAPQDFYGPRAGSRAWAIVRQAPRLPDGRSPRWKSRSRPGHHNGREEVHVNNELRRRVSPSALGAYQDRTSRGHPGQLCQGP